MRGINASCFVHRLQLCSDMFITCIEPIWIGGINKVSASPWTVKFLNSNSFVAWIKENILNCHISWRDKLLANSSHLGVVHTNALICAAMYILMLEHANLMARKTQHDRNAKSIATFIRVEQRSLSTHTNVLKVKWIHWTITHCVCLCVCFCGFVC